MSSMRRTSRNTIVPNRKRTKWAPPNWMQTHATKLALTWNNVLSPFQLSTKHFNVLNQLNYAPAVAFFSPFLNVVWLAAALVWQVASHAHFDAEFICVYIFCYVFYGSLPLSRISAIAHCNVPRISSIFCATQSLARREHNDVETRQAAP